MKKVELEITGTLVDASYSEEFDTVTFEVEAPDGQTYAQTWLRKDFGYCMGICKKGQIIPVKMLVKWLPNNIGKENCTIKYMAPAYNAPDLHEGQIEDINGIAQNILNFVADQSGRPRVQIPEYKPRFVDPIIGGE